MFHTTVALIRRGARASSSPVARPRYERARSVKNTSRAPVEIRDRRRSARSRAPRTRRRARSIDPTTSGSTGIVPAKAGAHATPQSRQRRRDVDLGRCAACPAIADHKQRHVLAPCAPSGRRPTARSGSSGHARRSAGTRRRCRSSPGCAATRRGRCRRRSAPSRSRAAAAAPPDEPPALRDGSYGLRVAPKTALNVCEPAPNSGVLVLPTSIGAGRRASARRTARRRRARGRRRSATRTSCGCPPCRRGPCARSAGRAAARAPRRERAPRRARRRAPARRSVVRVTIALTTGFQRSIRARCASSTSRADTSRSRIIARQLDRRPVAELFSHGQAA